MSNYFIVGGGRSCGRTLKANKELLKQWPAGTIAYATKDGVRYSELADAEEIKD
jgi:hypothetical protein